MLVLKFIMTSLVASLFLTGCDSLNPEEIRKRQQFPGEDFVANAQQGKILFAANCSQCHGQAGLGTRQGPPLINKIYRAAHHADITFYWAVRNGVKQHHWAFGDMPPIKNVSPEDVGHIIAYIRQQQRIAGI